MLFKGPNAPLCRCCFKPIKKATEYVYFGQMAHGDSARFGSVYPRNRGEVQDLVNGQIVSISWRRFDPNNPYQESWRNECGGDYIDRVTTWDGESYQDGLFCTDRCGVRYARAYAEGGFTLSGYEEALEAHEKRNRK